MKRLRLHEERMSGDDGVIVELFWVARDGWCGGGVGGGGIS